MNDFEMISTITLNRIYDVLIAIYAETAGSDKASLLMSKHNEGILFAPPPSVKVKNAD